MSKLLKKFANDKQVSTVLNDPEKLKQVLFIIQDAADDYMNQVQTKLSDPRSKMQEEAQIALDIATKIIEAEKNIRELELYNFVGIKSRGMSIITDV